MGYFGASQPKLYDEESVLGIAVVCLTKSDQIYAFLIRPMPLFWRASAGASKCTFLVPFVELEQSHRTETDLQDLYYGGICLGNLRAESAREPTLIEHLWVRMHNCHI